MEKQSPFKFLESYSAKDQEVFFGRDSEIRELYDRVHETNLILLYGASGTGKTSLVNCGLASQFEKTDWLPITVRRKVNINESFEEKIESLADSPLDKNENITKKISSIYLDHFRTIYFIFDQLEELFILGTESEQLAFFNQISGILTGSPPCKILLVIREEYLAHLYDFELILPALFDNRMRVERMNRISLNEVITGTTRAYSIDLAKEENIPAAIIDKLIEKDKGVELAYLQIYLDQLYKNDQERKKENRNPLFDEELVRKTGSLENVLSQFLDEQLAKLNLELVKRGAPKKDLALKVLAELITPQETKLVRDLKSVVHIFEKKNIDPALIEFCIKKLIEIRIVKEVVD